MLPADVMLFETVVAVLLVAAAVAAVILLLLYLGYRQRTGVIAYAEVHGWRYVAHDQTLARRYTGHPFVADADARAEAVITGDFAGMPFAAYAYTYQVHYVDESGKESLVTETIPVVSLLLQTALPELDVVPTGSPDSTWCEGSTDHVDTGSEEFAGSFTTRSADPDFARAILHPRLTHDLMAFPERGWSVRGGDFLSIGSWNGKPEKITSYLDLLAMIVHSVPAPVWVSYGGRTPHGRATHQRDDPGQPNSSSR